MSDGSISTERLNILQEAVRNGNAVLILGPRCASSSINVNGEKIPTIDDVHKVIKNLSDLEERELSAATHDDLLAYINSNLEYREKLEVALPRMYSVRTPSPWLQLISNFIWHRIYTFDISDSLEVSYRRNNKKVQIPRTFIPSDPINIDVDVSDTIEIVKLYGDVSRLGEGSIVTSPGYAERWTKTPWFESLIIDVDARPIIFVGEEGDAATLLSCFRHLKDKTNPKIRMTFICPDLSKIQIKTFEAEDVVVLPLTSEKFLRALAQVFPRGRSISDILQDTKGVTVTDNERLSAIIYNDFRVLTLQKLNELHRQSDEPKGGIRRFYRGDDATWVDVIDGVYADFVAYKNFRGRIEKAVSGGSGPGGHLFVLSSPAGMGKTIGLMATAVWLRNITSSPILWFNGEGDLGQFFDVLSETEFSDGAFLFIDDITTHRDAFNDRFRNVLNKFCIISSAREIRWKRYSAPLYNYFSVKEESVRSLNYNDAKALHSAMKKYGTLVYFESRDEESQVREILDKSGRDLLVLIKELGQGQRFERTVASEVSDLNEEQRFCYFLACITHRVQIPMPQDLLEHSVRTVYPDCDVPELIESLGRLVRRTGARSIVSRHAIIAERIIDSHRLAKSVFVKKALEALLKAFAQYRIPILVHHSNTGHARVFKSVINNKFLTYVFGYDEAIKIYRNYEKAFDKDAFFWNQFGLTYLRAGWYDRALETLRHAVTIHDHPFIRHSLAYGQLVTCLEKGPRQLGVTTFTELREEAIKELGRIHRETGNREDYAISTLADYEIRLERKHGTDVGLREKKRFFHTRLAVYLREQPAMPTARKIYERINAELVGGRTTEEGLDDELLMPDQ